MTDGRSAVLTWAVGAGHRESDPTAAAVAALPRQTARPKHHAAIPHAEMAAAMSKIRASNASPAARLAVKFAAASVSEENYGLLFQTFFETMLAVPECLPERLLDSLWGFDTADDDVLDVVDDHGESLASQRLDG